jgi:Ca-activated chloride channel homolog
LAGSYFNRAIVLFHINFRSRIANGARPFIFAFALFIASITSNFASNSFAQGVTDPDETITTRTDLVTLPIVVTDRRGGRIGDLTRADFTVSDNGRPVEIAYFAVGADRVALTFLLDASGSSRETIAGQREAALALFEHFGGNSRVAVLRFDEQASVVLPFTRDSERVRAAFQLSPAPNRPTAIFDAAMRAIQNYGDDESSERRIIILISDGLDTASTVRARQVIEEANRRGVTFYVVHLPLYAPRDGALRPRSPSSGFRELASRTGGQFFTAGDERIALEPRANFDFTQLFRAIENDLRSQYVIGFYRNEQTRNQSLSQIEVSLTSEQRRLRVRSLREGR